MKPTSKTAKKGKLGGKKLEKKVPLNHPGLPGTGPVVPPKP